MSKRIVAFTLAVLLSSCSSVASAEVAAQRLDNPHTAAAEVRRLEEGWVAAWRDRDYSVMERILAPEFMLASSGGGQGTTFNNRAGWLKNARVMAQLPFQAWVVDVVVAADTAVATLEARCRRESFPTDTWVKRNGQWQIISAIPPQEFSRNHSHDAAAVAEVGYDNLSRMAQLTSGFHPYCR